MSVPYSLSIDMSGVYICEKVGINMCNCLLLTCNKKLKLGRERKENQEYSEYFIVEDFKGNMKNPNKAHSHKGFFSRKAASTT